MLSSVLGTTTKLFLIPKSLYKADQACWIDGYSLQSSNSNLYIFNHLFFSNTCSQGAIVHEEQLQQSFTQKYSPFYLWKLSILWLLPAIIHGLLAHSLLWKSLKPGLVWFELLGKADISISNMVGGPEGNEEVWFGRLQYWPRLPI